MHFHVLGVGATGSLISHHLRRVLPTTHSITLIYRTAKSSRNALSHGGLIQIENDGLLSTANGFRFETFHSLPIAPAKGSMEKLQTIESLFVATKAHHTIPALNHIAPRLSKDSTIVLLQNGMGVYEMLINEVFRNPEQRPHFILASNTHGAFRKDTFHIVHTGQGNICFGIIPDYAGRAYEAGFHNEAVSKLERKPRLSDITTPDDPSFERYKSLRSTVAALLLLESLNASWNPIAYMQTVMRRKVVVNAVINPLTALMGCRNGDIFSTRSSYRIMRRICLEASSVFKAQAEAETQTWLDTLVTQGIDAEDVAIGRLPPELCAPMLEREVLRIARGTEGNISSMLSDIRRGRTTEIDFINGYLLNLGATYNIRMPANAMLLNLVKMRTAIPLDQML
jgi:2-dehydropantoate 2-reductase